MDKKSLIGFILIFIIILLMPKYFQWINKGGTVQRPVIEEKASATKRETPTTTEHQKGKASPQAASSTTTAPFRVRNYPIDTLTVETDLYIAKISSSGGGTLKSLILKNYKSIKGKDTVLVDLIPQGQEFPLYNSFISIQGDSIKLNFPFKIKDSFPYPEKKYFTISGKDTLSLTFVLETEYGPVTRKLTFYGNRYY
ncbi:MAG: membrane protein insertase YidC, partial [Candidatus Marinimicrobia bacterium]|nr:membrane protein insertase YidC [Candidatus Neomarinimicrobiota bacterium]